MDFKSKDRGYSWTMCGSVDSGNHHACVIRHYDEFYGDVDGVLGSDTKE